MNELVSKSKFKLLLLTKEEKKGSYQHSMKTFNIQLGGLLCQLKLMILLYQRKTRKRIPSCQCYSLAKDGEILGWSYECILPKLRYEKISVKVKSENPVITPEELIQQGLAMVTFANLVIAPLGTIKWSIR